MIETGEMRAVVMRGFGSPDILERTVVEKPTPADDEVLIRTRATTVTAGDCEFRRLDLQLSFRLPFWLYVKFWKGNRVVPGQEVAGEIESVGDDVTRFVPGDQVFAATVSLSAGTRLLSRPVCCLRSGMGGALFSKRSLVCNTGPEQKLSSRYSFLSYGVNRWGIQAFSHVSQYALGPSRRCRNAVPACEHVVGAIPIGLWDQYTPRGGLVYVSPEIVAATASLGASFMMLWLFTNRHEFIEGVDRAVIRRQASRSFILGLCALVVYLVTNFAIFEGFYWVVLRWAMGNPLRLIGDIILLVSYSGFFVLMTRAFVLLGMIEYYGSD